jgi:hypothetical protein
MNDDVLRSQPKAILGLRVWMRDCPDGGCLAAARKVLRQVSSLADSAYDGHSRKLH